MNNMTNHERMLPRIVKENRIRAIQSIKKEAANIDSFRKPRDSRLRTDALYKMLNEYRSLFSDDNSRYFPDFMIELLKRQAFPLQLPVQGLDLAYVRETLESFTEHKVSSFEKFNYRESKFLLVAFLATDCLRHSQKQPRRRVLSKCLYLLVKDKRKRLLTKVRSSLETNCPELNYLIHFSLKNTIGQECPQVELELTFRDHFEAVFNQMKNESFRKGFQRLMREEIYHTRC